MTTIEVELAALVVTALVLAVSQWLLWRSVLTKIVDREKAMDAHLKAVSREAQRATAAANGQVSAAQAVLDDARLTLERVERHVRGR